MDVSDTFINVALRFCSFKFRTDSSLIRCVVIPIILSTYGRPTTRKTKFVQRLVLDPPISSSSCMPFLTQSHM
jgi:hypothetical protein